MISLGLDTFVGDPYSAFGITTEGFGRITAKINAVKTPSMVLQDGGYISPELGQTLVAFLKG